MSTRILGAVGLFALLLLGVGLIVTSEYVAAHPEAGHDFLSWRLERALDRIDATDAQRERIGVLVEDAMAELHELRDPGPGVTHERMLDALLGDEVDREALEEERAAGLVHVDRVSRRLVSTLAEVAEVLTAEQRAELRDWVAEHGSHSGSVGRRGHRAHRPHGPRWH